MQRERLYTRNAPAAQRFDATRNMHVRAESVNVEAHTYDVILATQRRTVVYDWGNRRNIEEVLHIRGAEPLPVQVALLDAHARYSIDAVLGSIRNLRIEQLNGEPALIGTVHADIDNEDGLRAWNKVKSGHVREISVGYSTQEYVDIPVGERRTIGGQVYEAGRMPLRITTGWTPREGSLVPVGADPNAVVRTDPSPRRNANSETLAMNKRLRSYLRSLGLAEHATDEQAWAFYGQLDGERSNTAIAIRTAPDDFNDQFQRVRDADPGDGTPAPTSGQRSQPPAGGTPAPAPANANPNPAPAQRSAEDERTRILGIQNLPGARDFPDVVQRCVADGNIGVDQAARQLLEATRGARETPSAGDSFVGYHRSNAPSVHTHQPGRPDMRAALTAGVGMRMGLEWNQLPTPGVRADENRQAIQERLADQGEAFVRCSMLDICRYSLQADGLPVPHDYEDMVRAAVSTSTLNHMFTTSINAVVGRDFERADDTTQWCETKEVNNFQDHDDILMSKSSRMKRLPRGGYAQDAEFGDQAEKFSINRYAEQFTIDERDFIDDRFDLFAEIPGKIAEGGMDTEQDLVYALVLSNPTMADGTALFHTSRNNLLSGGSSALSAAAVEQAVSAMGDQRRDGRPLNIRASALLVPPPLQFVAEQILASAERREGATSNGTINPLRGRGLTPYVDSRLGTGGVVHPVTGAKLTGTATNWYLTAKDRTVCKVYLRGQKSPRVRISQLMQGQWGLNIDAKFDVGAFPRDSRGLLKSAGQ